VGHPSVKIILIVSHNDRQHFLHSPAPDEILQLPYNRSSRKKIRLRRTGPPSPIQERANVEEMMCSAIKKLKTAFMKKYSGDIRNTDKRGPTKEV
jgi:hypothetical protein